MSDVPIIQAFYNVEDFPELKNIQGHVTEVEEELRENQTWLQWGSDNSDPMGHCNFLQGGWTICPIYFGKKQPEEMKIPGMGREELENLLKTLPLCFPKTIALVQRVPLVNYAAFSRLHPQSSLAPHRHYNAFSLIFHLGVIIPQGNSCGLKVGEKTHIWTRQGDAVIFDDNLEHSAWNDSLEERIILYIDFFHSPLT